MSRRLEAETERNIEVIWLLRHLRPDFKTIADFRRDSTGRLMLAVLTRLADVGRDLIRTRSAEGRNRATARVQRMGRPPALTPQHQQETRRRRQDGATLKELTDSYNVSKATMLQSVKE